MNALGMRATSDSVVITDELGGRPCRKPKSRRIEAVARTLGLEMGELVVIVIAWTRRTLAHRVGVPVVRCARWYRDVGHPRGVATVDDFFPSEWNSSFSESFGREGRNGRRRL